MRQGDEIRLGVKDTMALRQCLAELGFELEQASAGLDPMSIEDEQRLLSLQRARQHFNAVSDLVDPGSDLRFTDHEAGLDSDESADAPNR